MLNTISDNIYNFFSISYSTIFDDLIVVSMIYTFVKILIMTSVIELIWPTQFFNKKHNISFQTYKHRNYIEVCLKLNQLNQFTLISNLTFLVYYII
jgi:hypothetical protein